MKWESDVTSMKEDALRKAGYFLYQVGNDGFQWKKNDDDFAFILASRDQAANYFYSKIIRGRM